MSFKWFASFSAALAVALALVLSTPEASAQRGELVRMADTEADIGSGKLSINTERVPGSFGELRIYNRGADVMIDNVKVIYSDGSVHNENRTIDLRRGERTRPIDPGRDNKFVDEVIITFKPTKATSGDARLQVYGMQDRKAARDVRPAKKKVAAPAKPAAPAAPEKPLKPTPDAPAKPAEPAAPAPVAKKPIETTKAASETRCVGEGSQLLRRANVGFGNDRDRLKIGGQAGKFDKIRLCVFGHDIDLLDIKVVFANGEVLPLPYEGAIKAGYRTQGMSLRGDRFIDTIDITYKKREGVTAFANVEIWGEVSEKWIDEESELFNDGWVRLTTGLTAGFVGFDTERAPVRPHKKGFSKIRVVTKDRDITLDYVDLIFADGTSQKIPANRAKVEPNVGFGPVDINGGPKVIKEIEARYRSRFFDKEAKSTDRAMVEIWAKR